MSEIEKPLQNKETLSHIIVAKGLRNWLVRLGLVVVTGGLGLFSMFWSYQVQTFTSRLELGQSTSAAHLSGFYPAEVNPDNGNSYRWTSAQSFVSLNYPSAPFEITFQAAAPRPDNRPVEMEVVINGKDLRLFAVDSQPRQYVLRSRLIIVGPQGLDIAFKPLLTFRQTGSELDREVGVTLDWIEVRQAASRFGPVIPPPFEMGWWVLVAWLPLGWVTLSGQSFKLGLVISLATFGLIDLLFWLPFSAPLTRLNWATMGAGLALLQVVFLTAGARFRPKALWSIERPGLRLPLWVWLLVGLTLLYISTLSGRLLDRQELVENAFIYNLAHLNFAAPLDVLLPDPPAGSVNPVHATAGLARGLLGIPLYWAGRKLANSMPFMPGEWISDSGLTTFTQLAGSAVLVVGLLGLLYWFLLRLGYRFSIAAVTTGLFGTTTTFWLEAGQLSFRTLDALALLAALVAVWLYREQRGWWWPGMASLSLGVLITDDGLNLVLIPLFGYFFYRSDRLRLLRSEPQPRPDHPTPPLMAPSLQLALIEPVPVALTTTFRPGVSQRTAGNWFWTGRVKHRLTWRLTVLRGTGQGWLLPFGVVVGLWLTGLFWYNLACFGSLFSPAGASVPIWENIYYRLASPADGLVLRNPVILLAFAGGVFWWVAQPAFTRLVGLTGGLYLLVQLGFGEAGQPGWQILEPVIPLAFLLIAPLVETIAPVRNFASPSKINLETRLIRYVLVAFSVLSLLSQLLKLAALQPPLAAQFYSATPFGAFAAAFQTTAGVLLVGWVLLFLLTQLNRHKTEAFSSPLAASENFFRVQE